MKRLVVVAWLAGCAGAVEAQHVGTVTSQTSSPSMALDASTAPAADILLDGFRITSYTLARESDLSGQRSGNRTRVTGRGLPGDYAWEFLCSGHGVAMQGTGITLDGRLVHYLSGGGGFCGRDHHLCDCVNARWSPATGVVGSTGRELTEYFSIAVDPTVIPYGSFVWIDAMKRWFRADDTGGAIIGKHIDIYVGTKPLAFNGETSVYVTSVAHGPDDDGPSGADTACARDGLTCGGDGAPGDARILYRCHDGRASFARACPSGCRHGNGSDACRPRPPLAFCPTDGWFCGGDRAEGTLGALYRCVDHGLVLEARCDRGCQTDPDGLADSCL